MVCVQPNMSSTKCMLLWTTQNATRFTRRLVKEAPLSASCCCQSKVYSQDLLHMTCGFQQDAFRAVHQAAYDYETSDIDIRLLTYT